MLRKIRTILAVIVFTAVTLLFLDFTGALHTYLGWLAKIQFLPAALALNIGVMAAVLALTLLLGRIYCSVSVRLAYFRMECPISAVCERRKRCVFSIGRSIR